MNNKRTPGLLVFGIGMIVSAIGFFVAIKNGWDDFIASAIAINIGSLLIIIGLIKAIKEYDQSTKVEKILLFAIGIVLLLVSGAFLILLPLQK